MSEAREVVKKLMARWVDEYGDTLDVEEIRRFLNRMLQEAQEKELRAVFSNWSGPRLNKAIDDLFDYGCDDVDSDVPPEAIQEAPVEVVVKEVNEVAAPEQTKKRGRPVGWRKAKS